MIVTARLLLREWQQSDVQSFAAINADAEVMRYYPSTLTRQQTDAAVDRIRAHFERYGFGLWAAALRSSGEFAGYIGLAVPSFEAPFTPCVEIGWRLASRFWNHGLATEGAEAVLEYGVDSLSLSEIVSFTAVDNLRSRRVMEKLGMTRDPAEDFEHPGLPKMHPLSRHVLYRL